MGHCLPTILLGVSLVLSGCGRQEGPQAEPSGERDFNGGWQVLLAAEPLSLAEVGSYAPGAWAPAVLPHTPRIEPLVVNDQWRGDAWYRKRFVAPESWRGRQVLLRFEGAMNVAEGWLNGQGVGRHLGGYLPWVLDLSERLAYGSDNELLVRLDNRDNPVTGPKPLEILDFNMYGGLYRDVKLIVRDALHVTDEILADRVAGGGLFVTYPRVRGEEAVVRVRTHVANTGDAERRFEVRQRLVAQDGAEISGRSSSLRLGPGEDLHDDQQLVVANPDLWSPLKPSLYRLVTSVVEDGRPVDERVTRIGIRELRFAAEGFSINGERMFLRGVNRHQEYPYVGYALSNAANYRDARKIKEAGFDYVRLSHYPHSPAFMDAADELGLVVLNAILGWQYFNDAPEFAEHAYRTCRDLVRRDRNHPGVIAWECSLNESAMPREFVETMHRIVHEEYPGGQAYSAGWVRDGYDIYLQARQHRTGEHFEAPGKPYIVSEYGDWEYYALNAGLDQDGWHDLLEDERTSRQLPGDGERRLLQQALNVQEAHNDNFDTPAAGDGYWVMFDYNRGYADDLEASGVMTIHRLPKYSYYFFRSQRDAHERSELYASGPMVFIASRWDADSSTRIRVFSNCDEVELLLNGASLGRRQPDSDRFSTNLRHPPFTFDAGAFAPGTLEARAYIDGAAAAKHSVSTPGAPVRLALAVDVSGRAPATGVNDVVFAHAKLLDARGTVVPENGRQLDFAVTGDIRILNPEAILTEAGVASVLVRIGASLDGASIRAGDPEGALRGDVLYFDAE